MSIITLSLALGFLAMFLQRSQNETAEEIRRTETEKSGAEKPESVVPYVSVDPLEVEIGYNLIPLVDPKQGGTLLDRITKIRRMSALNMGLIVPPIRIRDNMELAPESYSILIKGVDIGNGTLMVGKLMAMDTGEVVDKIEGQEFIEPTFGLNAIWIDADKRDFAERNGYIVVDCPTIIATHLTEIIKRHADEILGRQEVQQLIDNIKNDYPAVVSDIMDKNKMSLSVVQRVLQNLLRERVSIRNLVTIFETLANYQDYTTDPSMLTEYVRAALARQICNDYSDKGTMYAITVDPEMEGIIREGIHDDPVEGRVVGLDPQTHTMVINALLEAYKSCKQMGYAPVYLVSPHIRSVLFALLEREVSDAVVLSYNEITSNINVNVVSSAMLQSATA